MIQMVIWCLNCRGVWEDSIKAEVTDNTHNEKQFQIAKSNCFEGEIHFNSGLKSFEL
jgi:hypothetical protein